MRFGYLNLRSKASDAHKRALTSSGCERLFFAGEDKASESILEEALHCIGEADVLIVWSLVELGLSIRDTVHLIDDITSKRAFFRSLADGVDTQKDASVTHLCSALVSSERSLHRTRLRAGLIVAKEAGAQSGRRRKLTTPEVYTLAGLIQSGSLSVREAARQFGLSRSTLQRYLAEVRKARREA